MSQKLTCTLGYHSHTQWLTEPQIILLYDEIEMNQSVYNMVLERGRAKRSSLDILLSELLLEYESQGIIKVADYDSQISKHDKQMVEQLVSFWQKEIPNDLHNLAISSSVSRLEHIKRKLLFLELSEPMYAEITAEIKGLNDRIQQLRHGRLPSFTREGIKHSIEHVLFTDLLCLSPGHPIFEWSGYALVRQWLASAPRFPGPAAQSRRKLATVTEPSALNAHLRLFTDSQMVTDGKQLLHILKKREQLKAAREEIHKINSEIWDFVAAQEDIDQSSLLEEFRLTLQERLNRIQQQYQSIMIETEAARRKPLSQMVTAIVSSGISLVSLLVPIPGIADNLSEALGDWVARRIVTQRYPQLGWIFIFQEYSRVYEDSLLKRSHLSVDINSLAPDNSIELRESDFCVALGIERSTLYRWLDDGLIPQPSRGWIGVSVYLSEHLHIGRKLAQEELSVKLKGKTITRRHILEAIADFDVQFPNTNAYDSWIDKKAYKYAINYNGKLYPCKYILGQAAGFEKSELRGGQRTNGVLHILGFSVIQKISN